MLTQIKTGHCTSEPMFLFGPAATTTLRELYCTVGATTTRTRTTGCSTSTATTGFRTRTTTSVLVSLSNNCGVRLPASEELRLRCNSRTPKGEDSSTRNGLVPSYPKSVGKIIRRQWRVKENEKMKRVGNLYTKMLSDKNILKAIDTVNRSHRWRGNHKPNHIVMWVEMTVDERVKELREIIQSGFEPTQPTIKTRYDRNAKKLRDIAEPRLYPDQYVHHILIQTLEPVFMRGMDYYCCGSIKGRGAHYGANKIKKWMSKDKSGTKYCLEMDIYHFYEQLKPDIVMQRLRQLIKDNRVLDLCERSMKHGVTIGAYFSQWFANTLLQPLDQLIRVQKGVKYYLRYMDNFTVFSNRKKDLKRLIPVVEKWLNEHSLRLKDNIQYYPTRKRLPNALGYRYGHTYTLLRKTRLLSIKRQVKTFYKKRGNVSPKFARSLLSRLGGLRHCNSQNIYARYIPKGLQRRLKDIVRKNQREEMTKWSMCLAQYIEKVQRSKTLRP